jgi:hypothetical protein
MHNHGKPLALLRRLKVAGDQIEFSVSRREVMLGALVSAMYSAPDQRSNRTRRVCGLTL